MTTTGQRALPPRPVERAAAEMRGAGLPLVHNRHRDRVDTLGLTADGQSLPGADRPAFDWPKEPW